LDVALKTQKQEKQKKKGAAVAVHGARRQEHARNGCGLCFPARGASGLARGAAREAYIYKLRFLMFSKGILGFLPSIKARVLENLFLV
jgi:hypothetical protein